MKKYCKCNHPKVNFHISLSHCVNCNKQIKISVPKERTNKDLKPCGH